MSRTSVIITATAIGTLVGLGVAAHSSSAFKDNATTVGIVVLAVMSAAGLLGVLLAPAVSALSDRHLNTAVQLLEHLHTTAGAPHTGDHR